MENQPLPLVGKARPLKKWINRDHFKKYALSLSSMAVSSFKRKNKEFNAMM
jgi:hypothetical protein